MHNPRSITDEDVISQCKTGSLKYQELLYKRFYGYAMGIGLRYSLTRDDALEVANDAFIKAFNSIHNFDNSKPFKAWFRTIIINTAIDRQRRDSKFKLNIELEHAHAIAGNTTAIEHLNAQDILKMMTELPAIQSTVFNLHEIDGYSHDEIGGLLSIPASSSRVYLSRAKEKLRMLIKSEVQNHG